MPVTFIQSGRFGAAPSYHADAAALFARWGTDPGSTRKGLLNACIQGMDDDTDWALIDVFQVYAAHTQADGLLDWKNNSDATLSGTPTFTTDRGAMTGGSADFLISNFVPSTDGVNFIQDSACIGVYINDAGGDTSSSTTYACGMADAGNVRGSRIAPKDSLGGIRGILNSGSTTAFTSSAPNTRAGFTTINRSGASALEGYRNGSSVGTGTTASTGVCSQPTWIGLHNNGGSGISGMAVRFAAFMAAGSLDATRQARVYARLLTYLTAIGAN